MNVFSLAFVGDVEARYPELPWASLDPATLAPDACAAARRFWSHNAFSEHASAIAMAEVVAALGRAQVPPELWRRACAFPAQELVHVELCAGVARRCGGAVGIPFEPGALELPLHPGLLPLERATALVVRVFCLGEAMSLRLLAGNLRATTQPLARAVLMRIVRDEAAHARFAWAYLDWIAPRLSAGERQRLGDLLALDLAALAPLTDVPPDGAPASGLGWMAAARWSAIVARTLDGVLARLARYGICRRSADVASPRDLATG
ncbi:MAG: hypothetical protein NT062_22870 [Proteobacteria bacterium]|nr:hypothetical protein [Pseudomonadota bacterium]